jgi:hypothetical protein
MSRRLVVLYCLTMRTGSLIRRSELTGGGNHKAFLSAVDEESL